MKSVVKRVLRPIARPALRWLAPRVLARVRTEPGFSPELVVSQVFDGVLRREPEPAARAAYNAAVASGSLSIAGMVEQLIALQEFPSSRSRPLRAQLNAPSEALPAPAAPVYLPEPRVRALKTAIGRTGASDPFEGLAAPSEPVRNLTELLLQAHKLRLERNLARGV